MMKIQYRGKNIQVTEGLKEYIEKRLRRLDKYFGKAPEAIVSLSVEKERHRIEVTIPLNGLSCVEKRNHPICILRWI